MQPHMRDQAYTAAGWALGGAAERLQLGTAQILGKGILESRETHRSSHGNAQPIVQPVSMGLCW